MAEMVEDERHPEAKRSVKFDATISLGAVMQAGVLAITGIAFAVALSARTDQQGRDIVSLQDRLTQQITDLRVTTSGGLTDIRQQIATLPDQRAALEQTTRRLSDVEQRYNSVDKHLGEVERMAIECRADLNTMMRQAQVPLTGRRN